MATVRSPCSLLQAEQSQHSLPALTGEVLQTSDGFYGFLLDLLQKEHGPSLVLRPPQLDAVLCKKSLSYPNLVIY